MIQARVYSSNKGNRERSTEWQDNNKKV